MKKSLAISTLVLALVAMTVMALSLVSHASAQTPTPTAEAQVTALPGGGGRGDRYDGPRGGGPLRAYTLAAEAEAFGLTSDELQAWYGEGKSLEDLAIEQGLSVADYEAKKEAARQAVLEQAVADGAITQEQADALAERRLAGRPTHAGGADSPLRDYMQAALADAFGLTVDELDALEADGKTLKDVAIEQDLSVADYKAKKEAARQAALEQAVADGAITQEQADAMQNHTGMGCGGKGGGRRGECPSTTPENTGMQPES
ncbi:MAG: hypothetical protein ACOYYS_12720 [Chloroflexota bacterium]